MTHEDHWLDPAVLLQESYTTLFRYARLRFSNLSGIGSARAPGRWNRLGQRAVYTSTECSVPILERLVHTQKNRIPTNLAMMEIELAGKWSLVERGLLDENTGASIRVCSTLREARSLFSAQSDVAAAAEKPVISLAVPSVIVPVWNLVLFPRGEGFRKHIRLRQVTRFEFDPRLFPEDAVLEDAL